MFTVYTHTDTSPIISNMSHNNIPNANVFISRSKTTHCARYYVYSTLYIPSTYYTPQVLIYICWLLDYYCVRNKSLKSLKIINVLTLLKIHKCLLVWSK